MKRRLAAILAADVAGYSRLMEVDEEATLRTLKEFREIIDALIARHDGRVFGSAGDSVLAEFASPVEAVRCAVEIQEENRKNNANLSEDRRMRFRIGVHLGDVMADGDNLFGDGVNLAARFEGLAEPGGICVSEAIHAQVRKTPDLGFEFTGNRQIKNIAEEVPVYRVLVGAGAAPGIAGAKQPRRGLRWVAMAAAAVVVAGAVAMAVWVSFLRPPPPVANVASDATPAVMLSDRPSIAVLPFVNISGDDEQEYFADGMTGDLITDLSKISGLTVISRTSTSGYKGKKIDIREVGEALGIQYVMEGSEHNTRSRRSRLSRTGSRCDIKITSQVCSHLHIVQIPWHRFPWMSVCQFQRNREGTHQCQQKREEDQTPATRQFQIRNGKHPVRTESSRHGGDNGVVIGL